MARIGTDACSCFTSTPRNKETSISWHHPCVNISKNGCGRNSSDIITDINTYKNLYDVNGIFFDEMSYLPGKEDTINN